MKWLKKSKENNPLLDQPITLWSLAQVVSDRRGYDDRGYYRDGYRNRDGYRRYRRGDYYGRGRYDDRRYYSRSRYRCGDGTTGAIVGGAAGALIGRSIDRSDGRVRHCPEARVAVWCTASFAAPAANGLRWTSGVSQRSRGRQSG